MNHFNCPTCGETFDADLIAGRTITCTQCGRTFETQRSTAPPAAENVRDDSSSSAAPERAVPNNCYECGASIRSTDETCPDCGVEQRKKTGKSASRRRRRYRDDERRRDDDYDNCDRRYSEDRAIRDAGSKKLAAGLLAIFAGTFGIHKFILGFTTAGLIYLISTIVTCGLASVVLHFVALAEGIIYLCKTDEDFYYTYIVDKKEWF